MKATIKAFDTEGKPQTVQVQTDMPKLKTLTKNGVYLLEDLMEFAEKGKISKEMETSSPALLKMTQKDIGIPIQVALEKPVSEFIGITNDFNFESLHSKVNGLIIEIVSDTSTIMAQSSGALIDSILSDMFA